MRLLLLLGGAALAFFLIKWGKAKFDRWRLIRLLKVDEDREREPAHDPRITPELFLSAIKLIHEGVPVETSELQQRLNLGYSVSARIIDQMEDIGLVGPFRGPKPREAFAENIAAFLEGVNGESQADEASVPDNPRSPYEILGVAADATNDEIKRAYVSRISGYHPDKTSALGEKLKRLAEEESKKINAAYDAVKKLRSI
jgi:hypothetical protein